MLVIHKAHLAKKYVKKECWGGWAGVRVVSRADPLPTQGKGRSNSHVDPNNYISHLIPPSDAYMAHLRMHKNITQEKHADTSI